MRVLEVCLEKQAIPEITIEFSYLWQIIKSLSCWHFHVSKSDTLSKNLSLEIMEKCLVHLRRSLNGAGI